MGILLEANSLQKRLYRFKNFKRESNLSVKNVSLCVHEGEIVGLLGPNGAGKSTSLKMITGDLTPDEGRVIFDGQDITDWPMYKRCTAGLGYMPQENTLFKQLTVENNLIGIMQMQGFTQDEYRTRCEELMELFNLDHIRNNLAGNISGGEKRRLEVARALTKRPKMLILDEPFAGVDPKVTQSILDLVFDLWRNWGIAILITDHDYLHIIQMVQRCYVISSGEVVFEGKVDDLINDPIVQRDYLGNIEQQIITVDENGRKRVKNRHNSNQEEGASDLQTSISQNDVQNESSVLQSALPENSVIEQIIAGNDVESTQQKTVTATDSDLSELLQSVQTNDFQTNERDNAPSPTLSDFINQNDSQSGVTSSNPMQDQEDESDADNLSNPTNNQQQRKTPPSGPVIKPFRRKK